MSAPAPTAPDDGRAGRVRARRGLLASPARPGRRDTNRTQSSRVPLSLLPVALAVGVTVVVLVTVGLRPAPGPTEVPAPVRSTAATPAPVTGSAAAPGPTTAPDPVTSSTDARQTTAGSAPPAHATRTAQQRATGRRADGTAFGVPAHGSGTFKAAHVGRATSATGGRLVRFDVAVEHGLAVDPDQAALLIARVLDDDRSWRGMGLGRFTLVPAGKKADLHAFVATPRTTDQLCAPLLTRGKVSCQNGSRVVLNAERWVEGAKAYGDDIAGYRRYLVNHEFGHALGRGHVGCPGKGHRAPVMMQQTKGLKGCRPNAWPTRTSG